MKLSRSLNQAIFLIAGIAMIAGAWLWSSSRPLPIVETKPIEIVNKKSEILVARHALEPGKQLTEDQTEWVTRAEGEAEPGSLIRLNTTDTPNPYLGRVVVEPVRVGQALLPRHFLSVESGNYIAGLLEPGKRAFAIVIDSKGSESAGNFILPNDRVDIIRSSNTNAGLSSELILSNIRVLAIGTIVRSEGLSATGETATVEVSIREAEILATAQRAGQISLALRRPGDLSEPLSGPANLVVIRPSANAEKSP